MSIPFERLVYEDLNIGFGTVPVTMPAGGSATGNKIGLHSFLRQHYNVIDLDADPTGGDAADDAFDEALATASATEAGVIVIPVGHFKITRPIVISKAVRIVGSGVGTIIRGTGLTTGQSVFHLDGTIIPDLNYVDISNLMVLSDLGEPDAFTIDRVASLRMSDIFFGANLRHGLVIGSGERDFTHSYTRLLCLVTVAGSVVRFIDARGGQFRFSDCSFTGAYGVEFVGAALSVETVVFDNCNWETCDVAGAAQSAGLIRTLKYHNCRWEKNLADMDFSPLAGGVIHGVTFDTCLFETDVASYAINVSGSGVVTGLVAFGCYVKDYPTCFINMVAGEGAVIFGNTLDNIPAVVNAVRAGVAVFNNRSQTAAALGPQWSPPMVTPTYAATNVTVDRAYDADATTTAELADVLGTLIADLRSIGLVV